jgi:hypothetical protein
VKMSARLQQRLYVKKTVSNSLDIYALPSHA